MTIDRPATNRVGRTERTQIFLYCAHGDESKSTDADKRIRAYSVAAVWGSEDQWKNLRTEWALRCGGKIFHAADCESGFGDFQGMGETDRLSLYKDLTSIVLNNNLFGHSLAIDVAAYRELFPDDLINNPHFWAFGEVIRGIIDLTYHAFPQGIVRVTFDRNRETEYNAALMYEYFRRCKHLKGHDLLHDEIVFASRSNIGIQVADLIARESMKHLDNWMTERNTIRASYAKLRDSNRFNFYVHRKRELEERADQVQRQFMPQSALSAYQKWRKDEGLVDNISNRIRHMEMVPDLWES